MTTRTHRPRPLSRAVAGLALALLVTACSGASGDSGGGATGRPDKQGQEAAAGTLRVLASSELADMAPILEEARKSTGVTVRPTYAGTLDAVEQIASGSADKEYDAVWLSSNDYLRLRPDTARRITGETPIMASPVALGVRPAAVSRLGWDPAKVTWSQLHRAVADGKLTYGMTDPMRSNSGFSALVSVASGLSGAQSALIEQDVAKATPRLKEFFTGQKLTSGSSGWLATAYARRTDVDALVNYESVLLSAPGELTVIRPSDGVVTADYPLTLLTSARPEAKAAAGRLSTYLRTPGRPAADHGEDPAPSRRPRGRPRPGARPGPAARTALPRQPEGRGRAPRRVRQHPAQALPDGVRARHLRFDERRAARTAQDGAGRADR